MQGTNFLLRAIRNEAFEFNGGEYAFKQSPGAHPILRGSLLLVAVPKHTLHDSALILICEFHLQSRLITSHAYTFRAHLCFRTALIASLCGHVAPGPNRCTQELCWNSVATPLPSGQV